MRKGRIFKDELFELLERKADQYNCPEFIANDPISIPHSFSKPQDIEAAGFFAAILAWGQRVTIVRKCNELMNMMDRSPHEWILHHRERDLKQFLNFRHRTFNPTDALYFIAFLRHFYRRHDSLVHAFYSASAPNTAEACLRRFHNTFFSLPDSPERTRKHISTPERKSTCKRLSMYLRWMVRKDNRGVDFGLWNQISPSDLVCPCDLHVDRVARQYKLITRNATDWQTVLELTTNLKQFDPADPVKYDFALFGLGVMEGVGKAQ